MFYNITRKKTYVISKKAQFIRFYLDHLNQALIRLCIPLLSFFSFWYAQKDLPRSSTCDHVVCSCLKVLQIENHCQDFYVLPIKLPIQHIDSPHFIFLLIQFIEMQQFPFVKWWNSLIKFLNCFAFFPQIAVYIKINGLFSKN